MISILVAKSRGGKNGLVINKYSRLAEGPNKTKNTSCHYLTICKPEGLSRKFPAKTFGNCYIIRLIFLSAIFETRISVFRATVFAIIFCGVFSAAVAQSTPDKSPDGQTSTANEQGSELLLPELPKGTPSLPSPSDRGHGLLISIRNYASFQELLLAPIAIWIKEGRLALRVARSIDFSWRIGAIWHDASQWNGARCVVSKEGYISSLTTDPFKAGNYCGDAEQINNESSPDLKASKILWSVASAESVSRELLYDVEISWIGAQAMLRRALGTYYRRYSRTTAEVSEEVSFFGKRLAPPKVVPVPTVAPKAGATVEPKAIVPPLAQELIVPQLVAAPTFGGESDLFRMDSFRLFGPPILSGYSMLSWRFRGANEDSLWTYSPAIKKARTLVSSNRSDGILGSSLSFDDLFVWSNKPSAVNVRIVAEKVLLVPFVSAFPVHVGAGSSPQAGPALPVEKKVPGVPNQPVAEPVNRNLFNGSTTVSGIHRRADGSSAMVLWNHETRQLPQLSPWVPSTAVFVPRNVWILEITPKDPFYAVGREVLIVDKESLLPVYKIVYDRFGDYRKTIIGGWGMAAASVDGSRFPFLGFVMAIERDAQSASLLTVLGVHTFYGKDVPESRSMREHLNPYSLIPKQAAQPEEEDADEESSEEEGEEVGDSEAGAEDDGADSDDEEEEITSADEDTEETSTEGAKNPKAPVPADGKAAGEE